MTNEITVQQSAFIQSMERLAADPNVDPDKLQKLLDIQLVVMDRNARQAFAQAMSHCQREMPMIVRGATNQQTNSNYAKHEAICQAIKPIYTSHGFSLVFHEQTPEKPDDIRTVCDVIHEGGHKERYYVDLPLDATGIAGKTNKTQIHGKGSTLSYARRYLTLMIFDLATYDDNDSAIIHAAITEEQAQILADLLRDTNSIYTDFCKFMKVSDIKDIPAKRYQYALNALETKKKKGAA